MIHEYVVNIRITDSMNYKNINNMRLITVATCNEKSYTTKVRSTCQKIRKIKLCTPKGGLLLNYYSNLRLV